MDRLVRSFPNPADRLAGRSPWQVVAAITLGLWLGGSLLLDLVVMPALYMAGMTASDGFAAAGSMLFGWVDHLELLAAGLVLAAVLALAVSQGGRFAGWGLTLAIALLGLTAIETYWLVPSMAATSLSLNWAEAAGGLAPAMTVWHSSFFAVEILKVLGCGALLLTCEQPT